MMYEREKYSYRQLGTAAAEGSKSSRYASDVVYIATLALL